MTADEYVGAIAKAEAISGMCAMSGELTTIVIEKSVLDRMRNYLHPNLPPNLMGNFKSPYTRPLSNKILSDWLTKRGA